MKIIELRMKNIKNDMYELKIYLNFNNTLDITKIGYYDSIYDLNVNIKTGIVYDSICKDLNNILDIKYFNDVLEIITLKITKEDSLTLLKKLHYIIDNINYLSDNINNYLINEDILLNIDKNKYTIIKTNNKKYIVLKDKKIISINNLDKELDLMFDEIRNNHM